ncbi:MAG: DUF1684 domain-containing protein [Thermoanaerobaculia bacterium]
MTRRLALPCLFLGAVLAGAGCAPRVDPVYRRAIENWREQRAARLQRADGWLTLAGLFWLDPGRNPFGSDPSAKIVLPGRGVPPIAGAIVLENGRARLEPSPGTALTADGHPAAPGDLASDENGKPTVLQIGTFSFFVIRRGPKMGVRVRDTESAARKSFKGLKYFPIDPAWRVEAKFEPYSPPKQLAIPTVLGFPEDDVSPGALVFEHGGTTFRIDPVFEQGSDELFIIFGDRTNGKETYGAGRFVYAPMPKDGKTVIDFNKAYCPPCVFTPYATCPLPPPENRLPIEVRAGEKNYSGAHH